MFLGESGENQDKEDRNRAFVTHVRIVWSIFLLLTFFYVFYLHTIVRPEFSDNQSEGEYTLNPSVHIEFISRYALGLKYQFEKINGKSDHTLESTIETILKNNAVTFSDKVLVIPVIAEISGLKKTMWHMEHLETDPEFPRELQPTLDFFRGLYLADTGEDHFFKDEIMIEEYGWFAELAYLYGRPSSDPEKKSLMISAEKTVLVVSVATMLFFSILIGGCVLCVVALFKVIKKRIVSGFNGTLHYNRFQNIFFLETMVLFMLITVLMVFFRYSLPVFFYYLLYFSTPLLVLWIAYRGVPLKLLLTSIGWHKGEGFFKEVLCGFAGYLAGIPLVLAAGMITIFIQKITGDIPVHPIAGEIRSAGFLKIIWILTLASVIAPVFEETIFRGVFYNFFRKNHSILTSVFLTGFVFAIIHPQGIVAVPVICIIGINLALIREWRNSLIASVTAHACNNFVITCMIYFMMS